jgi:hypothetical protein
LVCSVSKNNSKIGRLYSRYSGFKGISKIVVEVWPVSFYNIRIFCTLNWIVLGGFVTYWMKPGAFEFNWKRLYKIYIANSQLTIVAGSALRYVMPATVLTSFGAPVHAINYYLEEFLVWIAFGLGCGYV